MIGGAAFVVLMRCFAGFRLVVARCCLLWV